MSTKTPKEKIDSLWQRFRDPGQRFERAHTESLFALAREQLERIDQLEAPVREAMALASGDDGVDVHAFARALMKKVEGQRKHINSLEAARASQPIERDAERYRWLRSQHWNDSVVAVVTEPKVNVRLGVYCPSEKQLDDFIDAARAVKANLMSPESEPQVGPLKLDNDRQVFFYEQDHYYLSNFSAFNLRWRGIEFPTSEHAYHYEKFSYTDQLTAQYILRAPSAHEAFKIAEREKARQHPAWNDRKIRVMRNILRAKVDQHEYVRRKLLETGDRDLIENSWRDDFWGWGPNRDGKNMLGKLWMEVRAELRAGSTA